MQPTAADPALRGSFLALLRSLATAHALDAEELEQQVWLRAAVERRRSDPRSRLRALTVQEFRRAREEAHARTRELEAAALLSAARTAAEAASPELRALGAEEARELRAAIARLPARCPALVAALLELPPMSYRELAEELAMPRGSIGPTRSRCLACLRRLLLAQRPAERQPIGRQPILPGNR
jgi:RNA polymerase sigma factor (sigma-70 family)